MPKRILFALLLMGFTSLVVQTLLIREFLITFYGNELTIGLILANWIILESLGSLLSSRASLKSKSPSLIYALLQTAIALYLPLSIFLIRNSKNMLGLIQGEGIGIIPIAFTSFFILAPLSLLDGAQFPFGCRILSDTTAKPLESTGRVYILEAIGFILAGPLFTYILITRFNSFYIVFILGLLNLFSAILLLKNLKIGLLQRSFCLIANLLLLLTLFCFFGPASKLHEYSINKQWQERKVLSYRNSLYANLVVTESKKQYTFYSDGIPIITTPLPELIYIEELVHFTMLAHHNPKKVLLLSGGAGGVIKELLKYPIDKLVYSELDPELIKLVKDFPTEITRAEFGDPRLKIEYIDGRRLLDILKERFDVAILNLPMPSTLQLNRFYTKEFLKKIKALLNDEGIYSFSLPGSLSYLNPQLRNLNASILNTLKDTFYLNHVTPNGYNVVNIIPGDFNLYLASPNKFNIGPELFLNRLTDRKVETKLLNKTHLEYRLHPRWLKWFESSLSDYHNLRKNYDLLPTATFYAISYWNSIFSVYLAGLFKLLDKLNFKSVFLGLLALGILLFFIKKLRPKRNLSLPVGFAIASTGFVGMSLDLLLIYTYQASFGFVFSQLALLVTAFMAGLAWGSWRITKRLKNIKNDLLYFSKIELALVGFCLLIGPLFLSLNKLTLLKSPLIFFLLSAVSGILVGSEFPLANKIYAPKMAHTKTAGLLYGLDLLGAWLASLSISIALVPVLGIPQTCLLLACLKIISLSLVIS